MTRLGETGERERERERERDGGVDIVNSLIRGIEFAGD